jgi:ferric-dicitrate binding protein FerR (iron transport regulator)
MTEDIHDIHDILAQDICGESLSRAEKETLLLWRRASDEHERIYKEFLGIQTAVRLLREHGTGTLAARVTRAIRHARRLQLARRATRHAAVILLLLGASLATWRVLAPVPPAPLLISLDDKRPTLRLGDSRAIILRRENTGAILADPTVRATNEGDRLVYEPTTSAATRVHTLTVPVGGEYRLRLSDGTVVFLNSGTELRYPGTFAGGPREVHLRGEAWFEVEADADRPFIVHAGGVEVKALGTSFNVNAYEQTDRTLATLVTGRLQVTAAGRALPLLPGQQALHDRHTGALDLREVETTLYTSWKDGYYTFDRAPLEEIMTTLTLWYGIEVTYRDDDAKHLQFTGRLRRHEDATRALEMLGETRNVRFDIRGDHVTVSKK